MIVKKKSGTRWKYSRQVSWTLHHTSLAEINKTIDRMEYSLAVYEKSIDVIRVINIECFNKGILIARLKGKALYTGDEVKIIISDKIVY